MSLRITCPACKISYTVDDELRGKKIRCRECDKPLNIPAAERKSEPAEEGIYDRKGKSAPVPVKRPARGHNDDESPRRKQAARSPLLPLLLIGGGVGAVVVFGVLVLGGVLYF